MKERQFITFLFAGFFPFTLSIPRQYYLVQQGKNWTDALTYCRATHVDLAIIEDAQNWFRVQYLTQTENFNSTAWIGLYNDVNSWRWSLGNETLGSYTDWSSPNPDNWKGKESCGVTTPWGWNDTPCFNPLPFICYDATKTGTSRFIYISTSLNWTDAQSYCRLQYTDLATIKNWIDDSYTMGLTGYYAWFGLFRDTWKWTDGTIFTSIPLIPGQPDNLLKQENCMAITNCKGSDELCSDVKPFFCSSPITGLKQILRLKIQTDADVNDPSVKEAILNTGILQKLSGLGGIAVKWRQSSDGLVFKKLKTDVNIVNCQMVV